MEDSDHTRDNGIPSLLRLDQLPDNLTYLSDLDDIRERYKRYKEESEKRKQLAQYRQIKDNSSIICKLLSQKLKQPSGSPQSPNETQCDISELLLCLSDNIKDMNIDQLEEQSDTLLLKLLASSIMEYVGIKSDINFRYQRDKDFNQIKICKICNKYFQEDDICRTPDCNHLFHAKCICSLESEGKIFCPICDTLIPSKY